MASCRSAIPPSPVGLGICILVVGGVAPGACDGGMDRLISSLSAPQWSAREAAAREAARLGRRAERAIPALVRNLGDEDWRVGAAAADALGAIGPAAVAPVVETLSDGRGAARSNAAAALAQVGAPAVERLIRALGDERLVVRDAAAQA